MASPDSSQISSPAGVSSASLRRRKLGEILRIWKICNDEQIHSAIRASKNTDQRLGEMLVQLGFCSDTDVAKALAAQQGVPFIDLDKNTDAVSRDKLELLPLDVIKRFKVLPLGKEGNRIHLLTSNALDLMLEDYLRDKMKLEVKFSLASLTQIIKLIDKLTNESAEAIKQLTEEADSVEVKTGEAVEEKDDPTQGPVIKLVTQVLAEAMELRASDIHIEPFEDRVRLRYRIDGVCHERSTIPKRTQGSVIARLKIISGVRVEERRIPQDGRIKTKLNGQVIDFRVSFCPAYHGESVVLRLLRSDSAKLGLNKLGMRDDTLAIFKETILKPNGIFLVTGPTGSGKTTTLYSALQDLNRPDRKIITAEDPIEYNFKGINQCQVNEAVGMTFPVILKAMLRQAPNIILVGEIRDKPVGEVAIAAALTGHMVFSTLHTNDAPSAMTRLIDMGLKPFLIASSVQAVLAQRLVRILCDSCKRPDPNPDAHEMALCDIRPADLANGRTIMMPVGCDKCGGTGFAGRRGVYEIMVMNAEIRDLTFKRSAVSALRKAAVASGMRTLLGDGKLKILDGGTTPHEVSKIAQVEGTVSH